MSVRYLLDTNVVSEPVRPRPNSRVLDRMAAADGQMAIASIVWHELVFGVERLSPSRRRDVLERYLQDVVAPTLDVLTYDEQAAVWHARERARLQAAGRTPSFVDGQVAAIAATHGLVLVTRNDRDFSEYEGIVIEDWFEG